MPSSMETVFLPLAFLVGACVGSFINVVVYRLPAGLSLLYPPSRCPHCHTQLTPRDNIPILGWLLLRGKCRYCGAPIPWRYPTIEFLTALLFTALTWRFAPHLSPPALLLLWAFASWLLSLALIDLDTETLPNSLTQSGLILGIFYQAIQSTTPRELAQHLIQSTIGLVVGLWFLSLLGLVMSLVLGKEAMGGGDPKLLGMIGAWLGWQQVLITTLIASAAGLLLAGISKLLGKSLQKIRFGPFLTLGGLGALFWGQYLTEQYLQWFHSF
jgi:leader peptidase (prepilin peptidase)/N-methyltransferase